jgi:hypothetical protein
MPQATDDTIRLLVRQAARWSTAAQQDASPLIAALHANYGTSYASALRQIANDERIRAVTGIDAAAFEDEIARVQDAATRRLVEACPALAPPGRLAVIAKEAFGALGACRRPNVLAAAR